MPRTTDLSGPAVAPSVAEPIGQATRVAIVTNIPAPYREPVYEILAQQSDINLHVIYCSGREPDREWDLGVGRYSRTFLQERFVSAGGRYIHFNSDVWNALRSLAPDVVVTTGFNPTHLLAVIYSRRHGAKHIAMTDGTLLSEEKLSAVHRWVRHCVFARSSAFVAASEGGFALFRRYGVADADMYKSHLCANNDAFATQELTEKRFDFIFCGRFVAIKNPLFALDVAARTAALLGRKVAVVFVGSGELAPEMRAAAAAIADSVDVTFAGFAQQQDLPSWYAASKIFLFPTQWDPWGVVANEACAAGIPSLVSAHAGAVGELLVDGETACVLPLDVQVWADAAVGLLRDEASRNEMGASARARVSDYTYANAAKGIAAATRHAVGMPQASVVSDVLRPRAKLRRVTIIQRYMTHYRVPLFEQMRVRLATLGIDLNVIHSEQRSRERLKKDTGELRWATHVPCTYGLRGRVCWQQVSPQLHETDLVVVTQESGLLFNYLLPLRRPRLRWAFWGHGRNFQATRLQGGAERLKRWYLRHADWWFAYTEVSARVVRDAGFPDARITVLNNALDNEALERDLASVSPEELAACCTAWGIGQGPAGLMLGSLYAPKRLAFMLAAAQRIHERMPDFQLIVVGEGEQRELVRAAAEKSGGWICWLGVLKGREKALVLRRAQLILNPGMVGLTILDSLIAGVPMVTCDLPFHSPEIAYLHSGRNGLVTGNDEAAYADAVVALLGDANRLAAMRSACLEDAQEYTMAHMVTRFCDGIVKCLDESPQKP